MVSNNGDAMSGRYDTTRSGLKIAAIETFPIWVRHRTQLLVKVTANDGSYGWGEAGLTGRELAVKGAIEHYQELLIGEDAFAIAHIWQRLYRSQYFEGGRVLTAAISAIDIALHDLKSKALGVPVYELLGGKVRHHVECLASTFAHHAGDAINQAEAFAKAGFSAIRLNRLNPLHEQGKPEMLSEPRGSIAANADYLIRARETLGKNVTLGIDYHHRLSVAEAISFCHQMPPGTLDFLEEPIRAEAPEAYEVLRRSVDVPFAIGEEFASKWQALPYLERGITQFMRLDICNIGGFTEAMKVAGWSEAHYIDIFPHNPLGPICTAASIHLAAAVPNFSWLEYNVSQFRPQNEQEKSLYLMAPKLDGSVFQVPNGPGLGIEVDEQALRSESFRTWNHPMLQRRDGSHTNW